MTGKRVRVRDRAELNRVTEIARKLLQGSALTLLERKTAGKLLQAIARNEDPRCGFFEQANHAPGVDADIEEKDEIIGSTVYSLCIWGYSMRGDVLPVVARLAATLLDRTNPDGEPLRPERIEQIYENTRPQRLFKVLPGRFTKESRGRLRPLGTLEELAEVLIKNGGKYPRDPDYLGPMPQPELTPTAERDLDLFRDDPPKKI